MPPSRDAGVAIRILVALPDLERVMSALAQTRQRITAIADRISCAWGDHIQG